MDILSWKTMCPPARQGIVCFSLSLVVFTASFFSGTMLGFSSELFALTYWGPGLYFCLLNFILRYCYKDFLYEVSVRSAFLGAAFATGIYLTSFDDGLRIFGLYTMSLSMFHFSEFMSVALTNPKTLTLDSFILNHSVQYGLAAIASWVEFAAEYYFFPGARMRSTMERAYPEDAYLFFSGMKTYFWVSYFGFILCVGGEILRKSAMFTAKTNFNHTVQFVKRPDHHLVTHGVYSFCRHPSYVGWFYWSIGTQLTLLNPFCIMVYTLASWMFFRERVFAEELTLITFFGQQYLTYQKKVSTGLPFIRGHSMDSTQTVRDNHWDH